MEPSTALSKVETTTALAQPLSQSDQIRARLSELRISPKTIDLVVAQQCGTSIRLATEGQLNSMWNEVIGLLDIRISETYTEEEHQQQMKIMSGWVRREFPDLTREAVRRAYNLAVKGELEIKELIPRIAPRYVGEVLKAYRTYLAKDPEYTRVYNRQLLSSPSPEPSEQQINEEMEEYLRRAIFSARRGGDYPDVGNGLYHWLKEQGRIDPTPEEQKRYMALAEPAVRQLIAAEKEATESTTLGGIAKRKALDQMIEGAIVQNYSPDYISRVQAYAKYLFLNDYLKTL